MLAKIRRLIDECPPGAVRDQLLANFLRFQAQLDQFPARVAERGPFANADEARAVLEDEIAVLFEEINKAMN